ncbi:MAG: MerR family transcriptional regulator [Streptomyces sp.]|nr:MerR family transcriptional regulator [Streptomyces sp.]
MATISTAPLRYTTAQAAEHATAWRRLVSAGTAAVTPATIRKWASRGHLAPCGLDDHGHPLYAHTDLARAEKKTRGRALRLVGISTH